MITRSSRRLVAAAHRAPALVVVVATGFALAACGGPAPTPQVIYVTAAPTSAPTATPSPSSDSAATLCASLADLRSAQDDDIAPLMAAAGDAIANGNGMTVFRRPPGSDELAAVAAIVVKHANELDRAVFPAAPDLVVDLKDAYRGYGLGIVGIKRVADDPKGVQGQILDAVQEIQAGKQSLDLAITAAETARAAGTLSCP